MITSNMAKLSPECLALVQNTAHTLIAGTTGSGKSVLLNTVLYSLIKANIIEGQTSNFIMIDPKRVELKLYRNCPVCWRYVTEPEQVPGALDYAIEIMEDRYTNMPGKEYQGSHIYIVIDELADILSTPGVLERIVKIGRLGRAAHIHLLMCTQDPSRTTLSAQIMQNITTSVALRCKDVTESKQIIRTSGAENLPKHGKAIVSDPDGYHTIKIPFTPDEDIQELLEAITEGYEDQSIEIPAEMVPSVLEARENNVVLVW